MRYAIPLALLLVTTTTAVQAQQSNGSDTEQILKLLQGMNGRFDQLEQRLDKLEQEEPAVTPQADAPEVPAAQTPDAAAQSDNVAIPGWKVESYTYDEQGTSPAPIARFHADIGNIFFNLHHSGGEITNPVQYNGSAYFNAKVEGDYAFNMSLSSSNGGIVCDGNIEVEEKGIFDEWLGTNSKDTRSGSINLLKGKYKIKFYAKCYEGDHKYDSLDPQEIEQIKKSSVRITVIGPDDMALRDFEPDELFYVGKKPKEQKRSEATPSEEWVPPDEPKMLYAAAEPITEPVYRPAPGMGVTTRTANFRIAPTRSAISPFQIPAGVQLHILQKFPDWYKIRTPEGDIGFVHRSLVATN